MVIFAAGRHGFCLKCIYKCISDLLLLRSILLPLIVCPRQPPLSHSSPRIPGLQFPTIHSSSLSSAALKPLLIPFISLCLALGFPQVHDSFALIDLNSIQKTSCFLIVLRTHLTKHKFRLFTSWHHDVVILFCFI